jgi:hypothetical protein
MISPNIRPRKESIEFSSKQKLSPFVKIEEVEEAPHFTFNCASIKQDTIMGDNTETEDMDA